MPNSIIECRLILMVRYHLQGFLRIAFASLIAVVTLVHGNTVQTSKSKRFEHVSRVGVDLNSFLLQSRNFRNEVQSTFTFFFLQFFASSELCIRQSCCAFASKEELQLHQ